MQKKIIKQGGSDNVDGVRTQTRSRKVIDHEIITATEKAAVLLEEARKEAEALVQTARDEADAIRNQAREEGFREGLGQWESRILQLDADHAKIIEDMRPDMVRLAVRIAEKILRSRLDAKPTMILPIVEETLKASRGFQGGAMVLHVHPGDVPMLEAYRQSMLKVSPFWSRVSVAADDTLTRGGCRIETDFGTVDASLETQLKAIENLLTKKVD